MKLIRLLAVFAGLLATAGLANAQGVGASGGIKVNVTDPTGAVIANAVVTVSDAEKGVHRTAAADNSGGYVVTGLLPAIYEIKVEAPKFAPAGQKGVVVNVGQTVTIDFRLKVSSSEEMVVTSEAPVVDTERGSQADVVDERYIKNLPIDQRDYLTFTLLEPAVADARTVNGADLRVRQTPQSGLSFYGSNGRGNNVTVDGGEFNGDSGGVLVNLGQDAVQEFEINRTNYNSELGAASGASVNIVSKSGTNTLHGTVYGFFRNDAMDARNPFAATNALQPGQLTPATGFSFNAVSKPTKNSLNRQQFGGTLGFAPQKDKTFLFLSGEGLHDREETAVPLLTNSAIFLPNSSQGSIIGGLSALGGTPVPCLTGQPALPAATCAAILQNILTINPVSSPLARFLVSEFEANGGLFPAPKTSAFFSGRLDHTFSNQNRAYLRYLFGRADDSNPDVSGLEGVSRGSAVKQWTSSLLASWYHEFSARTLNEARAQWNLVQFNVFANDAGGPGFDLAGFAAFGRDITLPDFSTLRQYQFADNLTLVRGRHIFKAGFDEVLRGNRTASATFMAGDFNFGPLPGGILSPCLQVPAACGLSTPAATINSLQSFALGLPSFYQQGFGNPTTVATLPLTSVFAQDSWTMKPNFTLNYGVRYELDQRYVMPTDHANFAPRVSFSWDPWKDHKTVIRGGAGLFYSPTYIQIDFATKELGIVNGTGPQIPNFLVPLTSTPSSALIFQTLFALGKLQGCGLSGGPAGAGKGACITQANLALFGSLSQNSIVYQVPSEFHNPYSEQGSFGIEHQFTRDLSISANYIYVHTLRLPRSVDTNLLPTAPINASTHQQDWGLPQCFVLVNNPCFASLAVLQTRQYQSNAGALYQGGSLELMKRFSNHTTVMANYTYSKARDDASDFSFFPTNEANFALDRGPSDFDQRHKATVAAVLESPWKHPVLSGFLLSPIVRYNSGQPFNVFASTDVNRDRHSNDRFAGTGRNSGIPKNYADVDVRLARAFKVGEARNLQFMAEAFNLMNRTNFSSLNNTCDAAFSQCVPGGPFRGSMQGFAGTSQPLSYNAVVGGQKRVIQLGARFSF